MHRIHPIRSVFHFNPITHGLHSSLWLATSSFFKCLEAAEVNRWVNSVWHPRSNTITHSRRSGPNRSYFTREYHCRHQTHTVDSATIHNPILDTRLSITTKLFFTKTLNKNKPSKHIRGGRSNKFCGRKKKRETDSVVFPWNTLGGRTKEYK